MERKPVKLKNKLLNHLKIGKIYKPENKYNGNELEYVLKVLDSEDQDRKETPFVQRLENLATEVFQSKYAIAHNSGTSTLHTSLIAAGVKPGDEVISPAHTVIMNSFVTLHQKALPVYVDIDPDTFWGII